MKPRPPRSTRTDTLFPDTPLRQAQGERGWNILAMDAECLQLGNQFIDIGDLDAGRADGRFRNLDRLDARRGVDAVIGGGLGIERLRLRLPDVRPRGKLGSASCRERVWQYV